MAKKKENGHLSIVQIIWNNKLSFFALVMIFLLTAAGLLANVITSYEPNITSMASKLQPPNELHIFGCDNYGRDIFARVIYGARISLWLGVIAVGISFLIGVFLGGISGYYGGNLGMAIMRFMDAVSAFPALILAITITTVIGRGAISAIISVGIVGIPDYARLMYSQTLSIKERGFIEAGFALGLSRMEILTKHIFNNCLPTLVVKATNGLGVAILTISALSFLGLGVQPPYSEWGAMISEGRGYIISGEWWISFFPGIAIAIAVLSFNLLGDGLRDILDPRTRSGS